MAAETVEMVVAGRTGWIRGRVDRRLAAFFDEHPSPVPDPEVSAAYELLREFVLDGGKRIRPVLCYWGWRGAGGAAEEPRPIVDAAAALELCHAGLLIHDDIMDASATRRGRPTLHRALGESPAILLGVLAMTWGDELLATCGADPVRLRAARVRYDAMRTEVITGQYLDLLAPTRTGVTVDQTLTTIRYKTAKYTVERPLQIGGELAGAEPALLAAYSRLGLPLGEAFQLRDDILGMFGDPAQTGKSCLDDLREGKHTVMIAHARAHASGPAAAHLRQWYGNAVLDERQAAGIREIVAGTGSLAHVESMITQRVGEALETLTTAPIATEAREALTALADRIAHRKQ
ncbi:polyprenyl synthetase family protein [Nonomuraea sp. NPDC050310]|uniref:polyprenyl synthetase family protein n=1 Tax=Nonomuraea sp. NPDC050310 TaxID=3154935 RepID=UPI0033C286D5